MDTVDPRRRMGVHGRLVDATLLRALLLGGPDTATALAWLERVGDGLLAVSAWSVLQLEGEVAKFSQSSPRQFSSHQSSSHQPTSQPVQELLRAFLEERAPVAWFMPEDFAMVGLLQRQRPGLAPLPLLLQLQQAFRLGLLPATLNPLLAQAALALGYPVEVPPALLPGVAAPDFTSSAWGAASLKPS
jgi:hypothetical protein